MDSVTQTAPPPGGPPAPLFSPTPPPRRSKKVFIAIVTALVLIILVIGGAAAAQVSGLIKLPLPSFLQPRLESAEVLTRMYNATATITSATNTFDILVHTAPRDSAVQPFPDISAPNTLSAAEEAALERDQVRLNDARDLLLAIKQYKLDGGEGTYYPRQLSDIVSGTNASRIHAAITDRWYSYSQTAEGRNFSFTVRLETPTAKAAYLEAAGNSSKVTIADSNLHAITLTAASQPLSVALDGSSDSLTHELFNTLPVDLHLTLGATGTADVAQSDQETTAASYSIRGSLKMGGLALSGDIDTTILNNIFYVRLNEMPSLGLFDLSALKDKWVKIDIEEQLRNSGLAAEELEKFKQEQRRQAALQQNFSRIALETARDLQLLTVSEEMPPGSKEDKSFYHYKLTIEREKFAQFIELMSQKIAEQTQSPFDEAERQAIRDALALPQWQALYDAWQKNSSVEVWIDRTTFYPHRWQVKTALAPPDSVLKFKDKQVNITLTSQVEGINEPTAIQAPPSFISLEEAMLLVTGTPGPASSSNNPPHPFPVQGIQDIDWSNVWQEALPSSVEE